jgi:hypothetical protein
MGLGMFIGLCMERSWREHWLAPVYKASIYWRKRMLAI